MCAAPEAADALDSHHKNYQLCTDCLPSNSSHVAITICLVAAGMENDALGDSPCCRDPAAASQPADLKLDDTPFAASQRGRACRSTVGPSQL